MTDDTDAYEIGLTGISEDQSNLLASTELGVIVLDSEMRLRMFTKPACAIYPLRESDIGRPLSDFKPDIDYSTTLDDARAVLATGDVLERTVASLDGENYYALRMSPYRTADGRIEGVTLSFANTTRLRKARDAATEAGARLALALSVTGIGVWDAYVDEGRSVLDGNVATMFGLGGRTRLPVDDVLDRIDPRDRPMVDESFGNAIDNDTEYRVEFRVRDTSPERWLVGVGRLVDKTPGRRRVTGVNYDITAIKEAERQQALLVSELDHRVKNLFAIILSLVRAEGRRAETVEGLLDNIQSRISALARAHEASRGGRQPDRVALSKLVHEVMSPYGIGERVHITTEETELSMPRSSVTPFGLILHELATNAQKYGALSVEGGKIHIGWGPDTDGNLKLSWMESGGPRVAAPTTRGFGLKLVERSAMQMQGRVEPLWLTDGLELSVTVPAMLMSD